MFIAAGVGILIGLVCMCDRMCGSSSSGSERHLRMAEVTSRAAVRTNADTGSNWIVESTPGPATARPLPDAPGFGSGRALPPPPASSGSPAVLPGAPGGVMFDAPPPPTLNSDTSANVWTGDAPTYSAVLEPMKIVKVDGAGTLKKRSSTPGAYLAPPKTYEHLGPTYDEFDEEAEAAPDASGDPEPEPASAPEVVRAFVPPNVYEDHEISRSMYDVGQAVDLAPDTGVEHKVYELNEVWTADAYEDLSDDGDDAGRVEVSETSLDNPGASFEEPEVDFTQDQYVEADPAEDQPSDHDATAALLSAEQEEEEFTGEF